jgi:hypothetical protein
VVAHVRGERFRGRLEPLVGLHGPEALAAAEVVGAVHHERLDARHVGAGLRRGDARQ